MSGTNYHDQFIQLLEYILSSYFDSELTKKYSKLFALECLRISRDIAIQKNTNVNFEDSRFKIIYGYRCHLITQHLDINSRVNDTTVIDALRNNISVKEIMSWPMEKLAPNVSAETRALLMTQSTVEVTVKTTKLHKCPACGEHDATYTVQQTRSSDEPATTFLACVKCGKEWRQ